MNGAHPERGTTIAEALVATSLLITLVGGVAHLILQSHSFAVRAEQTTVATIAASARLERLRAIPWEYDLAGMARDAPALEMSHPGALERNLGGFHESLDSGGGPLADPATNGAAYIRRWAVEPIGADGAVARTIEVCVFAWPAAGAAPPLACLAAVRTRQP
jgi:hypothetical protein